MLAKTTLLYLNLAGFNVCYEVAPKGVALQSILAAASSMRNTETKSNASSIDSSNASTFGAAVAFGAAAISAGVAYTMSDNS
eukprot:6214404-Pleurochrysis_carterae.AAC.3